jgi:hypothetical protein
LVTRKKPIQNQLPYVAEAVDASRHSNMGFLIGRRFEQHFEITRPNHADVGSVLDRL